MPGASGKITIREVAAAAGVSTATVSLVYNNKGEVAQATRERVLAVGEELGYRPGWISKVFRSGRTNVIGVAVQHGATDIWEHTYLPYYRGIIAGAAMEALEHGYTITAMLVGPDGSFVDRFSLDGVIMVDPRPDDPFVKQALSHGVAVIAEGGYSGEVPPGPLRSVRAQVELGVPRVLDEFRLRGSRNPAFLRGPTNDLYTDLSLSSYTEWCESHAVEPFEYRLHEGQHPIDGARDLLSGSHGDYDSVYCLNSTYGRAIATAAAELGIDIPGDLAVAVAAEEHEAAADPRLIYLVLDPVESGAQSARTLIRLLEGGSPDDVLMPMRVLTGGSTGQERRRSRATDPSTAGSRTPSGRTGTAGR
ncbi:LacI family DNA-binding transcriptional regulator [Leucobacter sp. wl10]|uniref:LacI family DNA-binding transcriptional regulator n=1 Tax=Leucobacter sp. wl10 TaxID=2304677 RepID=UPI0013C2E2FE|nr:LacI family DNA-binding transcriptional regulator [Leucobacter sp. wl10]